MIQMNTHHAAWGAFSSAIVLAAIAFPAIANIAHEQRDTASWQDRSAVISEVEFDDVRSSELAVRLTELQTNDDLTPHLKDVTRISGLIDHDRSTLEAAQVNTEQKLCLAQAVYYEARSETRSGQKAVAEVVLNRVASKHYPNSICGVVFEGSQRNTGCQFSFTCDGSMDIAPKGKSWTRSKNVADVMMSGSVKPFTNRSTHYHTTDVSPVWGETMRMTKRVGSHVFYRFAPRNYTPSTPNLMVAPPS